MFHWQSILKKKNVILLLWVFFSIKNITDVKYMLPHNILFPVRLSPYLFKPGTPLYSGPWLWPTTLLCKMQYLLTCKRSRYCPFPCTAVLYCTDAYIYVTIESQTKERNKGKNQRREGLISTLKWSMLQLDVVSCAIFLLNNGGHNIFVNSVPLLRKTCSRSFGR